MMMAVEQSDTVGTYQRTLILFTDVKYFLLHLGPFLGLFTKAGRDDNEGAHLFFLGQVFYVVRTKTRSHHQNGQFGRWYFLHVVEGFHALHLIFLGVDDAQRTFITALKNIAHEGATRFVYIV